MSELPQQLGGTDSISLAFWLSYGWGLCYQAKIPNSKKRWFGLNVLWEQIKSKAVPEHFAMSELPQQLGGTFATPFRVPSNTRRACLMSGRPTILVGPV